MNLLSRARLFLISACLLSGCNLLAVKEQQDKANAYCKIGGNVQAEGASKGNLVVALFRYGAGAPEQNNPGTLVDHFVLNQPGRWIFFVKTGKYGLAAFQDSNGNQLLDRDEPFLPPEKLGVLDCDAGAASRDNLALEIPARAGAPGNVPADLLKLQVRATGQQLDATLGQALAIGQVTTLNDPRFSGENAEKGLWRPFDFLWETKPGVYFLEPYHPEKIPVLFVHGINGTPRNFAYLIERLDRSRFQPWVYYYPSGGDLDRIGLYLNQIVTQLKADYRFGKMLVVAHSMGGLVARSFILHREDASGDGLIHTFVSIASPWNGHTAAQMGVEYAPTPVRVWYDMAPGSEFLTDLFYRHGERSERRTLPAGMPHHLIFSFLPTESGDGTISLDSQLRWEAQQDAAHLYGIPGSHTGVLESPRTSELLGRTLTGSAWKAD